MNKSTIRLFQKLLGKDRCLTDKEDCIPYSIDASHFQKEPEMVLFPDNELEISEILKLANIYNIPITPRGAGSGLVGGAIPTCGGAVLSLDRMNRILEIDPENFLAIVEPGVINEQLNKAAREKGLFFAPDPASAHFSSIGGNIAVNAGGLRAVKYGVTKHAVLGLEVVTPSGEIIQTGSKCLKDVVGYGLTELFIGSEGTLGVISKAICKLTPLPQSKVLIAAYFSDMGAAAHAVLTILRANVQPSAMEFMDSFCLEALKTQRSIAPPNGAKAQLLIEIDGEKHDVLRRMEQVRSICEQHASTAVQHATDEKEQDELWHARRSLHGALGTISRHWHEEDISVPISRVPDILDLLATISTSYDLHMACLGHFGDGNIHISYKGASQSLSDGMAAQVTQAIFQATASLEGRIASEHGVGLAKSNQVGCNLSPETIELMVSMKKVFDPGNILNPGKCFPGTAEPFFLRERHE